MKDSDLNEMALWVRSQGYECNLKKWNMGLSLFIEPEKRKVVNEVEYVEDLAIVCPDDPG